MKLKLWVWPSVSWPLLKLFFYSIHVFPKYTSLIMYKETLFLNVWFYSKVWHFLIVLFSWLGLLVSPLYGYLLFSCFIFIIYAQISSNNCNLFFCTMHAILRYLVKIIDRRKFHNFVQLVSYPFCFMFKLNWRKKVVPRS